MMRHSLEGMVKRTTLAKLIAFQFILFMFLLGGGLQLVKYQLTSDAQALAIRVNNQTTCAFRRLVDAPIAGYKRTINIQEAIVNDPSRGKKIRVVAQRNVVATQKTLDGLVKFRGVYLTVPPDYKCPATQKENP